MEMNEAIYQKITHLCEQGDQAADDEQFETAKKKYLEAFDLIPEPKEDWEASTWVTVALGDVYYFTEQYEDALNYYFHAMRCPDGLGNPYVLLRLGECFFELGNLEQAQSHLLQAYMMEGDEIFEDEDPKYFNHIKDLI